MKLTVTQHKWVLNIVMVIGGILVGIGVADCVMAVNQLNLDQGARGLTIFSAGLTILVLIDNTKTQKVNEQTQQETLLQLKKVEELLENISRSQQQSEAEPQDMQKKKLG